MARYFVEYKPTPTKSGLTHAEIAARVSRDVLENPANAAPGHEGQQVRRGDRTARVMGTRGSETHSM